MRYIDEFRKTETASVCLKKIDAATTKPWTIMEICGGQTNTIIKNGIDNLLPSKINLVHGPGCPVCVTPLEIIDKAISIASQKNVIFTSFGDMLRVPGSQSDLLTVKANGADVRVVLSPLDAVKIAQNNPSKNVVFFAIGFETTAPANAMSVWQAHKLKLKNFSILSSHVLVPPAIISLLSSSKNRIQAFLAAGHVCTIMGTDEYEKICSQYKIPIVVTGFEPIDILYGLLLAINQLEKGIYKVENQYSRAVNPQGNLSAKEMINKIFTVCDRSWRGIGLIPNSGLAIKDEFAMYDAEEKYNVSYIKTEENEICIAGKILQGLKKPFECSAFKKECTPQNPIGAPMVSSEGACAAYYLRYN